MRACLTAVQITLPMLLVGLSRARLATYAAQVALYNGAVPHAEALYKIAITAIPEVPTVVNVCLSL